MGSAADGAWAELNPRQRIYLSALFDADQAAEEVNRRDSARGVRTPPARVWRRIDFNSPYSPVVSRLRGAGVYDSGAGATLAALRARGLIETETVAGLLADPVYVWLTRAGRAAARVGHAIPAPPRKPRWAVSQWLWREMTKVARAGDVGLPEEDLFGDAHLYLCAGWAGRRGNRPYLRSVTRHVPVTLHDHWSNRTWSSSRAYTWYHFTDEGRAHYTDHAAAYRQLYPAIDAPELGDSATGLDDSTSVGSNAPDAAGEAGGAGARPPE
ncbi:hypothetical protein [Streptodolium elevatio]|uniref:Uncharacterized protein n=1 Tax=Streptodolium elevatio TaxID=3157996 RepID=A0ABV3DJ60_9ACTN